MVAEGRWRSDREVEVFPGKERKTGPHKGQESRRAELKVDDPRCLGSKCGQEEG